MYKLECDLVKDFENKLRDSKNPFSHLKIAFEFDYQSGRTDIIGSNKGCLISFEAKLNRWRYAIHQAYRNTSFSHYSYVILPKKVAYKAAMYWQEFDLRGVGLLSISPTKLELEIPALRQNPIMPWITDSAIKYIADIGCSCDNMHSCHLQHLHYI